MTAFSIISSVISIITIASFVTYLLNLDKLIKSQNKLIKIQQDRIDEFNECYDNLMTYCLTHIHNEALDKEDYKTAAKCHILLNNIKEHQK